MVKQCYLQTIFKLTEGVVIRIEVHVITSKCLVYLNTNKSKNCTVILQKTRHVLSNGITVLLTFCVVSYKIKIKSGSILLHKSLKHIT